MKELAIIDADHITFRCAASAENDGEAIAQVRCDDLINRILHDTNSKECVLYLSGGSNFRYNVYPLYKANRKGKPLPRHLEACREHLIKYWGAKLSLDIEADDSCAIEHTKHFDTSTSVLVSLDKDLLQVPGDHFNFVKNTFQYVSPLDGWRNFFSQLIAGDGADNIPSYDGKIRNSVPQFVMNHITPLWEFTGLKEMWDHTSSLHTNEDALEQYAECLYILRHEEDSWQKTKNHIIMADGLLHDLTAL